MFLVATDRTIRNFTVAAFVFLGGGTVEAIH
jgi:hypothetical protein